jgi:competence protein ComEA
MKLLEKFSKKFGFTQTETNVILFIIFSCMIGVAVNIIKSVKNDKTYLEFSYKEQDSLFNAAAGDPEIQDTAENREEKKIASKDELLDFSKGKLTVVKKDKLFSTSKNIHINSASISELMSIPGVGKTVAERIIEYRVKHGQIKNIDELSNIKGIGKTKLNKIANFISLE